MLLLWPLTDQSFNKCLFIYRGGLPVNVFFLSSVVEPHFPAYQRIVCCFGPEILLESGEINREALGSIIFSQPDKRKLLNSITHPAIVKEMLKQILKYFVLGKLLGKEGENDSDFHCRILRTSLDADTISLYWAFFPFARKRGKTGKGILVCFLCAVLFVILHLLLYVLRILPPLYLPFALLLP